MTQIVLLPDPAAGTGIQMLVLVDDTPGALRDGCIIVTSESQDSTTEITDHPVEDGGTIADNAREAPESYEVSFSVALSPAYAGALRAENVHIVLDIPENPLNIFSLTALAGAAIGAIGDALFPSPKPSIDGGIFTDYDPVTEMATALAVIKAFGARCDIVTTAGTLYDMLITSIKRVRKDTGGADFTVQFKQIFTVSSETVDAPKPLQPRGAPAANKGAQPPAPADGATAAKSTALGAILGL